MYRPGAAMVLEDTAGFEAESLRATAGTGAEQLPGVAVQARGMDAVVPQATAVTAAPELGGLIPATLAGVPNGQMLPCTDEPDLFFAESPQDVEYAKDLCRGCPVRLACLTGALERREPWGVWGGELFLRGEIVPRKRPRGRPRKDDVAA
jgi:WhiB family transcriptional regulator, redox-sensing transcriptional regulator